MHYRIVLASQSPRRRMLLEDLGINFTVRTKDIEEDFPSNLLPTEVAEFLAKKKSTAYKTTIAADELIITADTLVALENEILNKPESSEHATQMLQKLSGKTHQVITGVALLSTSKSEVFSVISKVTFAKLSADEIEKYVSSKSPMDKAGSYGIQDWIGKIAVTKIEGSYENIVGLPTQELYRRLKPFL